MTLRPLTEYILEFASFKGSCTCSSESTLVKIPHCWISQVAARLSLSHSFIRQLITFTSSMDPDYTQDDLRSDLDPIC